MGPGGQLAQHGHARLRLAGAAGRERNCPVGVGVGGLGSPACRLESSEAPLATVGWGWARLRALAILQPSAHFSTQQVGWSVGSLVARRSDAGDWLYGWGDARTFAPAVLTFLFRIAGLIHCTQCNACCRRSGCWGSTSMPIVTVPKVHLRSLLPDARCKAMQSPSRCPLRCRRFVHLCVAPAGSRELRGRDCPQLCTFFSISEG